MDERPHMNEPMVDYFPVTPYPEVISQQISGEKH